MTDNLREAAEKFLYLTNRLRRLGPGTSPPEKEQISHSLIPLLEFMAANPGCGIQEMAQGLDLATPTVSIGVRQLEKIEFVERQPDPQDGRAVRLFLTFSGQEFHRRTHRFRRQKFEKLLAGLTSQERNTLIGLLEKALSSAENQAQPRMPK